MAKTFKNLYPKVVCFENLWRAYRKARRHKRFKEPAAYFEMDLEKNMLDLQQELASGDYWPGGYHHFYIYEPKKRKISAAPFRDRVVHHAIVNILEPLYEARFSGSSYACRKGKGTHRAMEKAHWGVRNCRYCLKGDIVRFYPSVDHEILKSVLFKKINDSRLQELVCRIIESGSTVLEDECPPMWFADDDLLSPSERQRGIPIGNLTSQFFANVLLNELDQHVHHRIKPRLYVRYMDDFLLFDNDKDKLHGARAEIGTQLSRLRLMVHPRKTCVRHACQGISFVGYKLLPQTRRIDRSNLTRFRKRMKRYRKAFRRKEVNIERIGASVRGWLAHIDHANADAISREVLADVRI